MILWCFLCHAVRKDRVTHQLAWRIRVWWSYTCKLICFLLYHVQKIVTFIFAHLWWGMFSQCCFCRTCGIFLYWSHSAIRLDLHPHRCHVVHHQQNRSLFSFCFVDGADESMLTNFGRYLLQGVFHGGHKRHVWCSVAVHRHVDKAVTVIEQGIAKVQSRGRDGQAVRGLSQRHLGLPFRNVWGALDVPKWKAQETEDWPVPKLRPHSLVALGRLLGPLHWPSYVNWPLQGVL